MLNTDSVTRNAPSRHARPDDRCGNTTRSARESRTPSIRLA